MSKRNRERRQGEDTRPAPAGAGGGGQAPSWLPIVLSVVAISFCAFLWMDAKRAAELTGQMLAGQALEKRAIRLLELPGKGMVVAVGLEQYDGIDAVPDPEIRSLIREAVADWERRASPGDAP